MGEKEMSRVPEAERNFDASAFYRLAVDQARLGERVLDLGAGTGRIARMLAEKGLSDILAVDIEPAPAELPQGVRWHRKRIEDWIEEIGEQELFNRIVLSSVIQFLDRDFVLEKLLPALALRTKPDGLVMIRTFTRDPNPPFSSPISSAYVPEDLVAAFPGWKTVLSQTGTHFGPGLDGVERLFFLADAVVRKPAHLSEAETEG